MPPKSPFAPGSPIVAYLRDSGHEDQELSIEQQELVIRNFCTENQLLLLKLFKDSAAPGSSVVGRAAFLEMIQYLRAPDCTADGLIIWKYNRFARDIDDAQFFKADLRRRGYLIHSMTDQVPEGLEGRFIEAAIDWMNAKYLADLTSDIRRGQQHLVTQHGALGGTPPRGFKREAVEIGARRDGRPHIVHRWAPDPDLVDRVRLAFRMRAEGASYAQIHTATGLYKSGHDYKRFFTNRIYIGILAFGDQVIAGYCEPVIDADTWETVQRIQAATPSKEHMKGTKNAHHPRRTGQTFLLSGLIFCARCGAALNGDVVKFKQTPDYRYEYYACSGQQRHTGCDARKIPRAPVENAILETIAEHILSPELVDERHDQIQRENILFEQDILTRRADLNRQLAAVRRQIDNLNDILAEQGTAAPRSTLTRITELETRETDIKSKVARIKDERRPTDYSADELRQKAEDMRQRLATAEPADTRKILTGMIGRIAAELDPEAGSAYLHITYYYPPQESETGPATGPASDIDFMPMSQCPRRDTDHRHKFEISITIPIRSKKKQIR